MSFQVLNQLKLSKDCHLTNNFFCQGCKTSFINITNSGKQFNREELNKSSSTDISPFAKTIAQNNLFDERGDYNNPTMDEESFCVICLQIGVESPAKCLVKGLPNCLECSTRGVSKRISLKMEDSTLESINKFFIDSMQNHKNAISDSKKTGLKRMKTFSMFNIPSSGNSSNNNSSIKPNLGHANTGETRHDILRDRDGVENSQFKLTLEDYVVDPPNNSISETILKKSLTKHKTKSIFNNNDHIMDNILGNNGKFQKNSAKNLFTSPKNSDNPKYKRMSTTFSNPLEKLIKSIDIILNSSDSKMQIHLPFIFQGVKNDFNIFDNHQMNTFKNLGNFLIIFLNNKNEFQLGIILANVMGKNYSKLFKKIRAEEGDMNSGDDVKYYEKMFDKAEFKTDIFTINGIIKFSLKTYTFTISDSGVKEFLKISPKSSKSLIEDINCLNIYDMC
jgi:hypothetical protein